MGLDVTMTYMNCEQHGFLILCFCKISNLIFISLMLKIDFCAPNVFKRFGCIQSNRNFDVTSKVVNKYKEIAA